MNDSPFSTLCRKKKKRFSNFYYSGIEGWLFEAFLMKIRSLEAHALKPQLYVTACALDLVIFVMHVSTYFNIGIWCLSSKLIVPKLF